MRRKTRTWLGILAAAGFLGAGPSLARAESQLTDAETVYTLVNLHADETRAKLTSVNYQLAGLIPLCTKVRFTSQGGKSASFVVEKTGKEYTYHKHKSLQASFEDHLAQYFGSRCNSSAVKKLSAKDRKGIEQGQALVGMTKQGVIHAIGYPPDHRTASTDLDQWRYWKNRFKTFVVHFHDGKVSRIQR